MDSTVSVFVAFNGVWELENRDWIFRDAENQVLPVEKGVTYEQLLDILYDELEVYKCVHDLKIEVPYTCLSQSVKPTVIKNDRHVRAFIGLASKSVEKLIPLCVTLIKKGGVRNASASASINKEVQFEDNISPPCHGFKGTQGDVRTCVPETNPDVIVHDNIPVRDPSYVHDTAEYDPYSYKPYVNDDPVADATDLGGPDVRADFPTQSSDIMVDEERRIEDRQTPGTSSSRPGLSRTDDSFRWSSPLDLGEDRRTWSAPMFTKEDIEASHQHHSLTSKASGELHLGKFFQNKLELKTKASIFAMKNNFEIMVKKSGTDVWYITCKDPDYGWRLRGKKKIRSEMFEITVYNEVHTCSQEIQDKDHRQASPWVVGHLIKRKFATHGTQYMANNIREDMKHPFGVEMSYEKAWRCRENALMYVRGTPDESYSKLLGYLCQLEHKNPGTITDFVAEDGHFLYCLFSLGVSRRGFQYCRPVICVDGTFLKNKYGAHMLCAVALDANNQLFPIAFALVDSENHNSWTYFMRKLKEAIGDVEKLAFVSDMHKIINHALELVFPDAYHGACYHHICMNVVAKFKIDHVQDIMGCAAYAFRRTKFHKFFDKIKVIDPPIAQYLKGIGFERWSSAYFPGNRYNIMTSNYAESFNNKTKEVRSFPVATFLEFIRFTLQSWFADRRERAAKATTVLLPEMENDLKQIGDKAIFLDVQVLGHHEFLVVDGNGDGEVNLATKSCSCGMFQTMGIPCVHAFATARKRSINIYSLCSPYYRIEALNDTYKDTIYPVGNEDEWVIPDHIRDTVVGVPVEKTPVGRPTKQKVGRLKTNRYASRGEKIVKPCKCSRCGGSGHNRKSCKTRI